MHTSASTRSENEPGSAPRPRLNPLLMIVCAVDIGQLDGKGGVGTTNGTV